MKRLVLFIALFQSTLAAAQQHDPRNQLSLWAVGSISGHPGLFDSSTNGHENELQLRYARYLYDEYGVTAHYTVAVTPFSALGYHNGGKAVGFGVAPLGAEVEFTHLYVRPMLTASGGFVDYNTGIFGGRNFNFTAQFGGGLRFLLSSTFTIDADYLFHHISNWNTGQSNPGMNNHEIALGFSRRW